MWFYCGIRVKDIAILSNRIKCLIFQPCCDDSGARWIGLGMGTEYCPHAALQVMIKHLRTLLQVVADTGA